MPQIGDTVKLKSKFYSWSGTPINADGDVTLEIYDNKQNSIETITEGIDNVDVGEYHYDYTIPDGFGYLVYKFSCDIGGKPAKRGGKIERKWVD
ncbi:MAG: hypothetical protein ACOCRK_01300 [bacterium]